MTKLETINAEDLQNRTYEPTHFLVDELIPEGLHILAGAPKIGKSWLALWLCLCVAQGQPLWNFATTQGEALYLSLEDSYRRIRRGSLTCRKMHRRRCTSRSWRTRSNMVWSSRSSSF